VTVTTHRKRKVEGWEGNHKKRYRVITITCWIAASHTSNVKLERAPCVYSCMCAILYNYPVIYHCINTQTQRAAARGPRSATVLCATAFSLPCYAKLHCVRVDLTLGVEQPSAAPTSGNCFTFFYVHYVELERSRAWSV